jgi:hypothetical protein
MDTQTEKSYWQDWVNLCLGLWLIASPWVMDYSNAGLAAGDAWILGVGVTVISIVALVSPDVWEEWLNLLLAAFILISPIAVGFTHQSVAVWNCVVLSVLIGIIAIWRLSRQVQFSRY